MCPLVTEHGPIFVCFKRHSKSETRVNAKIFCPLSKQITRKQNHVLLRETIHTCLKPIVHTHTLRKPFFVHGTKSGQVPNLPTQHLGKYCSEQTVTGHVAWSEVSKLDLSAVADSQLAIANMISLQ